MKQPHIRQISGAPLDSRRAHSPAVELRQSGRQSTVARAELLHVPQSAQAALTERRWCGSGRPADPQRGGQTRAEGFHLAAGRLRHHTGAHRTAPHRRLQRRVNSRHGNGARTDGRRGSRVFYLWSRQDNVTADADDLMAYVGMITIFFNGEGGNDHS